MLLIPIYLFEAINAAELHSQAIVYLEEMSNSQQYLVFAYKLGCEELHIPRKAGAVKGHGRVLRTVGRAREGRTKAEEHWVIDELLLLSSMASCIFGFLRGEKVREALMVNSLKWLKRSGSPDRWLHGSKGKKRILQHVALDAEILPGIGKGAYASNAGEKYSWN